MNALVAVVVAWWIAFFLTHQHFKVIVPASPRLNKEWLEWAVLLVLFLGLFWFLRTAVEYLTVHTPVLIETRRIIGVHLFAAFIASPLTFMLITWISVETESWTTLWKKTLSIANAVLILTALYELAKMLIAFFLANLIQ